jgi:hypothetical protein
MVVDCSANILKSVNKQLLQLAIYWGKAAGEQREFVMSGFKRAIAKIHI